MQGLCRIMINMSRNNIRPQQSDLNRNEALLTPAGKKRLTWAGIMPDLSRNNARPRAGIMPGKWKAGMQWQILECKLRRHVSLSCMPEIPAAINDQDLYDRSHTLPYTLTLFSFSAIRSSYFLKNNFFMRSGSINSPRIQVSQIREHRILCFFNGADAE